MGPDRLNTLDEYERHLAAILGGWPPERRSAFAAAMADRWLPAYDAFAAREDWGDPENLARAVDGVWAHVRGRSLGEAERSRLSGLVRESTPHMDDFDAPEALAAALMVQEALDSCGDDTAGAAFQAGMSGFEAVVPQWSLDPDAQHRLWERSAVRKELAKQLKVLERIAAVATFDDTTVGVLRRELRKPVLAGTLPRQARAAAPTLRTNQEVFEQYRAIIEGEIRSRRDWTPPAELGATGIATLWFMEWLGRYKRRMDLAGGAYGHLADAVGQAALVRRQQAVDADAAIDPAWPEALRDALNRVLRNPALSLDVENLGAPHGYGPSARRLWADARRAGKSDLDCWKHVVAWARHRPAVWGEEDRRKKRGKGWIAPALGAHLARPIEWRSQDDPTHPWAAEVDGREWRVRLNDFPDEIMYSLISDDAVVGDFHDWPSDWRR